MSLMGFLKSNNEVDTSVLLWFSSTKNQSKMRCVCYMCGHVHEHMCLCLGCKDSLL